VREIRKRWRERRASREVVAIAKSGIASVDGWHMLALTEGESGRVALRSPSGYRWAIIHYDRPSGGRVSIYQTRKDMLRDWREGGIPG